MCVIREMANIYTNSEITNVHFIYSEINDNVARTARLYQVYPNSRQQKNVFLNFINVYTTFKKFKSNLFNYGRTQFALVFLN